MSHTCRVTFMLPVEEKRDKIVKILKLTWNLSDKKHVFFFFQITEMFILSKVHQEEGCIWSLCFKVAFL